MPLTETDAAYLGFIPDGALWSATGLDVETIDTWRAGTFAPDVAVAYHVHGLTPDDVDVRWSAGNVLWWAETGFSANEYLTWPTRISTPKRAKLWKDAGVRCDDAVDQIQYGFLHPADQLFWKRPAERQRPAAGRSKEAWNKAGFGIDPGSAPADAIFRWEQSIGCRYVGLVDPNHAVHWRNAACDALDPTLTNSGIGIFNPDNAARFAAAGVPSEWVHGVFSLLNMKRGFRNQDDVLIGWHNDGLSPQDVLARVKHWQSDPDSADPRPPSTAPWAWMDGTWTRAGRYEWNARLGREGNPTEIRRWLDIGTDEQTVARWLRVIADVTMGATIGNAAHRVARHQCQNGVDSANAAPVLRALALRP